MRPTAPADLESPKRLGVGRAGFGLVCAEARLLTLQTAVVVGHDISVRARPAIEPLERAPRFFSLARLLNHCS